MTSTRSDRAGRVGGRGVAELLDAALSASTDARVHVVGHSYGCKVMLSALCARPPSRPVESVLLLQAAVSRRCFAQDADGERRPGGYRSALSRCRQPIYTTFSSRDVPLTRFFHLAVRRHSDIGERQIAAEPLCRPRRFRACRLACCSAGTDARDLQTTVVLGDPTVAMRLPARS